jgi:hypothetical protein
VPTASGFLAINPATFSVCSATAKSALISFLVVVDLPLSL